MVTGSGVRDDAAGWDRCAVMKRRIVLWLLDSWLVRYLMKWVIPSIRFGKRPIPEKVKRELSLVIRAGDCILTRDPLKLSNILIGGRWSHAAICTFMLDDFMPIIGEMSHSGFQELSLDNFLGYSQSVAVIRPKLASFTYRAEMATQARRLGFKAQGYDNVFTMGEKSLFCSELVYLADYMGEYKASLEDLAGLGHPYISPDGLYKAKEAQIVFEWRGE